MDDLDPLEPARGRIGITDNLVHHSKTGKLAVLGILGALLRAPCQIKYCCDVPLVLGWPSIGWQLCREAPEKITLEKFRTTRESIVEERFCHPIYPSICLIPHGIIHVYSRNRGLYALHTLVYIYMKIYIA